MSQHTSSSGSNKVDIVDKAGRRIGSFGGLGPKRQGEFEREICVLVELCVCEMPLATWAQLVKPRSGSIKWHFLAEARE